MNEKDLEQKLAVYHQAARRGTDWLLNLLAADGTIGPVEKRLYYYRVPWALSLMGEISAASRVLDWISKHMFTTEGAFAGVSPQGIFGERYGSYPLACLIVGASKLQRFDIVYRGTEQLLTWQDPTTGGFFNTRADMSPSGEQELFPVCQGGMTLLLAGHVEAARQAGQWVGRLWELQPDTQHRLYHVFTPAGGLVTSPPSEPAATYITHKDDPWQHHYNGGIAAAFLTELHMATGEHQWLELARAYQEFSITTDACQFQSMQVCKSGWGSGRLLVATGEPRYRDWTVRMGDWFVSHQFDGGYWENTKYWVPHPDMADRIELTAEFVMHVAHIISYLSPGA